MIGPTTLAIVLALAQPAPSSQPSAAASVAPSGVPQPAESATPLVPGPTPEPSATPMASPPATPSVAPSATPIAYAYRFVPRQPAHPDPGTPQIFAVYLNSQKLASFGPIAIKVSTDPSTVKVTSRSGGREGTLVMIAPGDFEANSKLPKIPFIAAGMTVDLEFTAVGADGRKTTVRVPVSLK